MTPASLPLITLLVASGSVAPSSPPASPPGSSTTNPLITTEPEAGGTHVRVETSQGPVHLFRPAGYDRRTAGLVVYVHGYYVHVDEAWKEHHLAAQFAASRRNAIFIVPDAPAAPEEQPAWLSLRKLIATALRALHINAPPGPLVVAGHSGAYRSIVPWLEEPTLHSLILIDALYGNEAEFRDWLARERRNRMTLIVKGTTKWADPFVRDLAYAVTIPQIPGTIAQLTRRERAAKLLSVRSQYGHFELITEGRVLPVLLARTPLRGTHAPVLRN